MDGARRVGRWGLAGLCAASLVWGAAGCLRDGTRGPLDGGDEAGDLLRVIDGSARPGGRDGGAGDGGNLCGDDDPRCMTASLGPPGGPFPLHTDPGPDRAASDEGVGRDANGWLQLDAAHAAFDYLWIANSEDWGRGTISKLSSRSVREVARYLSVTCSSLPGGSKAACDGTTGCCALDDVGRFDARAQGVAEPAHQAVQLHDNNPSRTAIDWSGDLTVANRAFGGQSSVTRIANDVARCRDRNGNGRIDTSSDESGDGVIQTDCNGNGLPDDLDDTRNAPCKSGLRQEFFGLDDECVLWTTNTNIANQWGRPLALGPTDSGASDVWAGTYNDALFFRIDGQSGLTRDRVQLDNFCRSYGAAIDASGIAWVPSLGAGPLCYFDTRKVGKVGKARNPSFGSTQGYGISLDRDQNVWVGGLGSPDAYRYTPDRTNGWNGLGSGWWVRIAQAGSAAGASGYGFGIAADSRAADRYFVWLAAGNGYLVRLPGSELDQAVRPRLDTQLDGSAFPAVRVAGTDVRGVGVDASQDLWSISNGSSVATRTRVDATGKMTPPVLDQVAAPGAQCPSGDVCYLSRDRGAETGPYTYSDFAGFGLRNFTRPRGTYTYVFSGCKGDTLDTQWYAVAWDADVPPNTSLTVRARTGITPSPGASWGGYTPEYHVSPADLRTGMPLQPFDKDDGYLQIEVRFSSAGVNASPKLKALRVAWKCGIPG